MNLLKFNIFSDFNMKIWLNKNGCWTNIQWQNLSKLLETKRSDVTRNIFDHWSQLLWHVLKYLTNDEPLMLQKQDPRRSCSSFWETAQTVFCRTTLKSLSLHLGISLHLLLPPVVPAACKNGKHPFWKMTSF